MKRFYYIVFFFVSAAVMSWVLPWIFSLCFAEHNREPFVAYSPLTDSFVITDFISDKKGIDPDIYILDPATRQPSKHYTMDQRDSLLPEIFVGQLSSKGMLPDSIKGVEIDMRKIRMNSWIFTSSPKDLNRSVPTVYPVMESMPLRFKFEDPEVVMTLGSDGVSIVDIETNSLDEQKTGRFAKMFAAKGFSFPAKEAVANISTRKGYDNGYLIIDSDDRLYHLKMQAGRPSMAKIALDDSIVPVHVFVMENADRELYGLVSDKKGHLYAVSHDDAYTVRKLGGVNFDPEKEKLTVMKNLFSWCIKINSDNGTRWIALDPQSYSVIDEYAYQPQQTLGSKIKKWIFPFVTTFTSESDRYVLPRVGEFSWQALFLNIALAIIVAIAAKGADVRSTVGKSFVTLLLGIYSFIPLMLLKRVK